MKNFGERRTNHITNTTTNKERITDTTHDSNRKILIVEFRNIMTYQ